MVTHDVVEVRPPGRRKASISSTTTTPRRHTPVTWVRRGGLSGLIASATFGGGAGLAAAVAAWTAAVRVRGRASRADR